MAMTFVVTLLYSSVELQLEICSDDTIYQVKQKIETLKNIKPPIKPEKQELHLGADKLQDELKVSDYNIRPGDSIRLLQKVAGVIQVFIINKVTIENTAKNSIGILIDPENTVLELKEMYHKKTPYPVDHQRLLWGRYQLEDKRTLSSYGIPHGANIQLVSRLRGGL